MMAKVAMKPTAMEKEAAKKPLSILGPSLMILRMSQRSSIRKIMAYSRLFFSTEYAGLVASMSQTFSVQQIMVMR